MATDTSGNQAVDYVWGNMPMQPDTGRGTALNKALESHNIAGYAYNGYPGNVANGGVVVPDLTGLTSAAAKTALEAVGLARGTVTGSSGVVTVQGKAAASHQPLGTAVTITIA